METRTTFHDDVVCLLPPVSIGFGQVRVEWQLEKGKYCGFVYGWGRRRMTEQAYMRAQDMLVTIARRKMQLEYSTLSREVAEVDDKTGLWKVVVDVRRQRESSSALQHVGALTVTGATAQKALHAASSSVFYGNQKWAIIERDIDKRLQYPQED